MEKQKNKKTEITKKPEEKIISEKQKEENQIKSAPEIKIENKTETKKPEIQNKKIVKKMKLS